jgi:2-polyprenyl-3-methyl-5-hydroxy-6-metoxy-1,4-benzoquinol methylase
MSMTDQQSQTLRYFRENASDWQRKAAGADTARVNIINQRNACVLDAVARHRGEMNRVEDWGCGSGELVIDLARMGVEAVGIDFSEEMIALCNAAREQAGVAEAKFISGSIFDVDTAAGSLDLVSGMGLIEYFSDEQFDGLLRRARTVLRPGGLLSLGSRNRLFNLVSLNEFTSNELELESFSALVEEARALSTATDLAGFLGDLSATRNMARLEKHPTRGVAVDVRHQFTPRELAARFAEHGFESLYMRPVHFHAAIALKSFAPGIHAEIANMLFAEFPNEIRLTPYCSSFVLTARKAA